MTQTESQNSAPFVITADWLQEIKDDQGLTRGQLYLLDHHTGGKPYEGKVVTNQVANFLKHCKGYRGLTGHLKDREVNRLAYKEFSYGN